MRKLAMLLFWALLGYLASEGIITRVNAETVPITWGNLKALDADRVHALDVDALRADPDFAGKPLLLSGTFRGGAYTAILYSYLVVPGVVTSQSSRILNEAYEVGLGQGWSFLADRKRLFKILDVLYDETIHYSDEERPPVMLFMLEAVASAFKWKHVYYPRASFQHHQQLRLAVDWWRWSGGPNRPRGY